MKSITINQIRGAGLALVLLGGILFSLALGLAHATPDLARGPQAEMQRIYDVIKGPVAVTPTNPSLQRDATVALQREAPDVARDATVALQREAPDVAKGQVADTTPSSPADVAKGNA